MEEDLPDGVHAAMFVTFDTKITIVNSVVVGATKAVTLNTDGSNYSSHWKTLGSQAGKYARRSSEAFH